MVVLQRPGETLYLPARTAHAILNLEENLSVTENYLATSGLEDLVHGLLLGESALQPSSRENERLWRWHLYPLELETKAHTNVRNHGECLYYGLLLV